VPDPHVRDTFRNRRDRPWGTGESTGSASNCRRRQSPILPVPPRFKSCSVASSARCRPVDYTFQTFNFRNRQGGRPFYDLLCSIATEEFAHVELVATTIGTMLTGASATDDGRAPDAGLATRVGAESVAARLRLSP
jgi:hypothetical protein